jgi:uncharacterized protein YyaL (SSP411 family)
MPNRLAAESSPYLLQHADNPVDWHAWGADAFALARETDRPVLLSIGYAACHWCHVMAHESFEDETTARIMNDLFVNVKVDREERPDVDSIYMQAVQAISGHGGWPMTMFLTPDGVPFYGGTYYPPEDRMGMPSFRRVLVSVSEAWTHKRADVLKGAESLRGIYAAAEGPTSAGHPLSAITLGETIRATRNYYDQKAGGFGTAPKFPQAMVLDGLLRHWARTGEAEYLRLVRHAMTRMASGGLYDHLGGGFHRYTVDAAWLVPHFEKMLYDNALLSRLAVHLWQATGDPEARRIAEETFGWVRREMTDPAGGWYSSLDADSEGHEGKFYVWSLAEVRALLGDDATLAELHWGITSGGNFEGANILHVAVPLDEAATRRGLAPDVARATMARAKETLFAARAPRVRPARDEKVLAGWNGLMLRAMAEGARAFDDAELRAAAVKAGSFLRDALVKDGRALRSWSKGRARIPGFLEDHAALALGFIALHQLTFDRAWLDLALALAKSTERWFWDDDAGAFFDTATDAEQLVTRPRDVTDNAIPSGTALALELQLLVAEYTGDAAARRRAEYALATLTEPLRRAPLAFGHLLGVADLGVHGATELALAGTPGETAFDALARAAARVYAPSLVVAGGCGEAVRGLPLLDGREAPAGHALAFVCERYACELPISEPEALAERLARGRAR